MFFSHGVGTARCGQALLLALASLALPFIAGCDTQPTGGPFPVVLVDAQGRNPFEAEGRRNGTLTITVQQGSSIQQTLCPVVAGDIRCDDFAISSYAEITRIRVEAVFDGGTTRWLGATPRFVPLFYPTIRVVIGPAGTCGAIADTELGETRIGGTLLSAEEGVSLYAVGGLGEGGGATNGVDIVELPLLTWPGSSTITPSRTFGVEGGLGETRAILFDDPNGLPPLLVLSGNDVSVVRIAGGATTRASLALHAGAGVESAVYTRGPNQVIVVGGRTSVGPVSDVSVIDLSSDVPVTQITGALTTPRASPAVAVMADGSVLVAGGQDDGPLFELLSATTARSIGSFGDATPRALPVLALDPSRRSALLVGGADASGAVIAETVLVSTCTTVCGTSAGPLWPTPRLAPASVRRQGATPAQASTVLLGGTVDVGGVLSPSDAVDVVGWSETGPSFRTLGPLSQRRERHSSTALGSDVLLVAGGQGVDAGTRVIDICWPEAFPAL